MQEKVTRQTSQLDLNPDQIWQQLSDLSFWSEVWHPQLRALGLNGQLCAGASGVVKLPFSLSGSLTILEWQPTKMFKLALIRSGQPILVLHYTTRQLQNQTLLTAELAYQGRGTRRFLWPLVKRAFKRHFSILITKLSKPVVSSSVTPAQPHGQFDHQLPLGFKLYHLHNRWERQLRKMLRGLRLTPTQWLVLDQIAYTASSDRPVTASQVAREAKLNKVLVSDVTKTLVRKHLVHKLRLPGDKRKFFLRPTAEGKSLAKHTRQDVLTFDASFFAKLTPEQRQALTKIHL